MLKPGSLSSHIVNPHSESPKPVKQKAMLVGAGLGHRLRELTPYCFPSSKSCLLKATPAARAILYDRENVSTPLYGTAVQTVLRLGLIVVEADGHAGTTAEQFPLCPKRRAELHSQPPTSTTSPTRDIMFKLHTRYSQTFTTIS